MTDNMEAQPQLDTPQASKDESSTDNRESDFPWQSKRPWEKLGMSRSAWWRKGNPEEKPVPPSGTTVIPERHRRQHGTRTKPTRFTTPSAQAIRDTVVQLWTANRKALTFGEIKAAVEAKGIEAKSRNNLYYHIDMTVKLGLVPPGAIDMQPRAVVSAALLDQVVRLATPDTPGSTTSIPQITAALIREGHLAGDPAAANGTQKELVRRYVNKGKELGRIEPDWLHDGHRSEKRERIKALTQEIVAQHAPINVRGVFYKLLDRNVVSKDDVTNELNRISNVLVEQREDGIIHPDHITDIRGTIHHIQGYSDPIEAFEGFVNHWYRCDPWVGVEDRVVIGIEKAGLGEVVKPVCDRFQVPLIVAGGFGSYTLAWDTAKYIRDHDGPTFIYYFGDHDPSGLCIDDSFERRLYALAPRSEFTFTRIGLKRDHIIEYCLSTHPVNKNDRRAPNFVEKYGDEAADLDALDPGILRGWVERVIRYHISDEELDRAAGQETEDKIRLRRLIESERLRSWIEQFS